MVGGTVDWCVCVLPTKLLLRMLYILQVSVTKALGFMLPNWLTFLLT